MYFSCSNLTQSLEGTVPKSAKVCRGAKWIVNPLASEDDFYNARYKLFVYYMYLGNEISVFHICFPFLCIQTWDNWV